MELGEAVDRISWGEWNWKVMLVGNSRQSEAVHRSPHRNKSVVWDGLRVWATRQGVTAAEGFQKSRYESQTRARNRQGMNPARCISLQENQHLQQDKNPTPTCQLHPEHFSKIGTTIVQLGVASDLAYLWPNLFSVCDLDLAGLA